MKKEKKKEYVQLNCLKDFEFEKTPVIAGLARTTEMIALKPIALNLGLSWTGALERLKRHPELSQLYVQEKKVAADGKMYENICLPAVHFQNWLWNLNRTENMNVDLWEKYKKGLVIYLLEMLKTSYEEVQRLRVIEQQFTDLKRVTVAYINANDEVRNYSKLAKEKSNEVKSLQQTIIERIEDANTNQLTIFN